jgi:hypothetical protein
MKYDNMGYGGGGGGGSSSFTRRNEARAFRYQLPAMLSRAVADQVQIGKSTLASLDRIVFLRGRVRFQDSFRACYLAQESRQVSRLARSHTTFAMFATAGGLLLCLVLSHICLVYDET